MFMTENYSDGKVICIPVHTLMLLTTSGSQLLKSLTIRIVGVNGLSRTGGAMVTFLATVKTCKRRVLGGSSALGANICPPGNQSVGGGWGWPGANSHAGIQCGVDNAIDTHSLGVQRGGQYRPGPTTHLWRVYQGLHSMGRKCPVGSSTAPTATCSVPCASVSVLRCLRCSSGEAIVGGVASAVAGLCRVPLGEGCMGLLDGMCLGGRGCVRPSDFGPLLTGELGPPWCSDVFFFHLFPSHHHEICPAAGSIPASGQRGC